MQSCCMYMLQNTVPTTTAIMGDNSDVSSSTLAQKLCEFLNIILLGYGTIYIYTVQCNFIEKFSIQLCCMIINQARNHSEYLETSADAPLVVKQNSIYCSVLILTLIEIRIIRK